MMRLGAGHSISPALAPAGSFHAMVVAMPASPGFCQYVCHFGRMRWWIPIVIVLPGSTAFVSAIMRAVTCLVSAVDAARSGRVAVHKVRAAAMATERALTDFISGGASPLI